MSDGESSSLRPGTGDFSLLVGVEGGADLVDLGAMDADGLVENLGGDVELVGPVGHVRRDFRVNLVRIVGGLGVFFMGSVGLVGFRLLLVFYGLVFGHARASCTD
jgi:hypothetical protein